MRHTRQHPGTTVTLCAAVLLFGMAGAIDGTATVQLSSRFDRSEATRSDREAVAAWLASLEDAARELSGTKVSLVAADLPAHANVTPSMAVVDVAAIDQHTLCHQPTLPDALINLPPPAFTVHA